MKDFRAGKVWNSILLGMVILGIFVIRYVDDAGKAQLQQKEKEIAELQVESKLMKIKSHILGSVMLSEEELKALDINQDGKVTASDYVLLKNENNEWELATSENSVAPVEELVGEGWISLGEFKITHYGADCMGCSGITVSGTTPTLNKTIATDPDIIPTGSEVMINGQVYTAEDTGGAIQGNVIDMYVESEAVSYELGIYYTEVYVKEIGR